MTAFREMTELLSEHETVLVDKSRFASIMKLVNYFTLLIKQTRASNFYSSRILTDAFSLSEWGLCRPGHTSVVPEVPEGDCDETQTTSITTN
jgi:hypothetical protein